MTKISAEIALQERLFQANQEETTKSLNSTLISLKQQQNDYLITEKLMRDQENTLIAKYQLVKTDLYYQNIFISKLLQVLFNTYNT
jgi:hypothetical protein